MVEICDSQSGILLQDLWEWWKEHKQRDFDRALQEPVDYNKFVWPHMPTITC